MGIRKPPLVERRVDRESTRRRARGGDGVRPDCAKTVFAAARPWPPVFVGVVVAVVLVVSVVLADVAAGSRSNWRKFAVSKSGFSIQIPASWKVVPQSSTTLRALIHKLIAEHQLRLAAQYQVALTDPSGRQGFLFDAFQWPEIPGPFGTDVIVKELPLSGTGRAARRPPRTGSTCC